MKKSKHKNTDQDYLHVVEFSQGKPNEISFNVLGKKSSASAGPEKKGFWARLRRKNKGSYEGFGASMALGRDVYKRQVVGNVRFVILTTSLMRGILPKRKQVP